MTQEKNPTPSKTKVPAIISALYTEHYVVLRKFTLARVIQPDLADELLQELFIKMVARGHFDDIDDIRSYLCRIILNLINDHHRNNIRLDRTTAQLEIMGETQTSPGLDPQNVIASRQTLDTLQAALDELPDSCRDILVLSRFEGLTHAQIAEKLNISKSWVEKNIIKALRFCRQKLDEGD